jgi:hypothetical protein
LVFLLFQDRSDQRFWEAGTPLHAMADKVGYGTAQAIPLL